MQKWKLFKLFKTISISLKKIKENGKIVVPYKFKMQTYYNPDHTNSFSGISQFK